MAKIQITQIISRIGSTARQKRNLDALGLKKMNRTVVHEDSSIIKGMIEKVKHLVKVEAAPANAKTVVAPKAADVAAPKSAPATAKAPAAKKVSVEKAAAKPATPKAAAKTATKAPAKAKTEKK